MAVEETAPRQLLGYIPETINTHNTTV